MELAGCQVMAKPTGSVCNIDCTYCFYLEKEALSKSKKITLTLSYEELDFLKMQVRESTKAVEELKQNILP